MERPLCYKTSNNKYRDCPPRMSDGRHFTDYRPSCLTDNLIRFKNQIFSNSEYRAFLSHNAKDLMKMNQEYACQKNCCQPCAKNVGIPPQETMTCDGENCRRTVNNVDGMGVDNLSSRFDGPVHNTCYPGNLPPNKCSQ